MGNGSPHMALVACIFSLRIAPEGPPPPPPSPRYCWRGARGYCGIQSWGDKVLIGVGMCVVTDCLVVGISWRVNLPGRRIGKRMRPCREDSHMGRQICPPRRIFPLIGEAVQPGELAPPPPPSPHNFNRMLEFTPTRIGFHEMARYTSNAFRRGVYSGITPNQGTQ